MSLNTPTPQSFKSHIEEAISEIEESDLPLVLGFVCLILCKEAGKLEAAVTALEQIADGVQ